MEETVHILGFRSRDKLLPSQRKKMIPRQIRKTRKPNRRKNVIELGLIKILITLE